MLCSLFSSLEISQWLSHQQVLSFSLSLSLVLSVTLLCSISFWGYPLVSLPLAHLFLYMSLSLNPCLHLSESLILPLTDSVSISLFLSASLWSPLCLSFPGHPPLLSLILFPSLTLSFIPFLPPFTLFLATPGFLGKIAQLLSRF